MARLLILKFCFRLLISLPRTLQVYLRFSLNAMDREVLIIRQFTLYDTIRSAITFNLRAVDILQSR